MLVQGTGWGPHAAVAALSHGQPLHLAEAALLTHAFLVHALQRLLGQRHTKMGACCAICNAPSEKENATIRHTRVESRAPISSSMKQDCVI